MIRPWFRALARKVLPGRPLQAAPRRGRRRGVCLRCESLEERVVMYAANFQWPEFPAGNSAIVWTGQSLATPGTSIGVPGAVSSVDVNGPGLDRLLTDLRTGATPPATVPTPP